MYVHVCKQNLTGFLVFVRRGILNIAYNDSSPASRMLSFITSKWLWIAHVIVQLIVCIRTSGESWLCL